MTRFDKMEAFYLNLLRGTILVLATVFLLVAVGGIIFAAPKLVPNVGRSDARNLVAGATLQDFRSEQNGVAVDSASTPDPSQSLTQSNTIDGRLVTASKNFVAWGAKNGNSFPLFTVEKALDSGQKSLNDDLQGDYADSLVKFSRDTLASTNSTDDLATLIKWHLDKFLSAQSAALEAKQSRSLKNAAARQEALVIAGGAAAAFMTFLILLFVFVLVKIERNLRIVAVRGVPPKP